MPRKQTMHSSRQQDWPTPQGCEWSGCDKHGEFQAPKSRNDVHDYYHFCLDHVREYNAKWNYYSGLSEAEIDRMNRQDVVWERPSWPFGMNKKQKNKKTHGFNFNFRDPFEFFDTDDAKTSSHQQSHNAPPDISKALSLMDLRLPLTLGTLKKTYKTLVKANHPDAHGGDPVYAEKFKAINNAYQTLKSYLQLA